MSSQVSLNFANLHFQGLTRFLSQGLLRFPSLTTLLIPTVLVISVDCFVQTGILLKLCMFQSLQGPELRQI